MIFVFEKLMSDHRANVEAWMRAREKWVNGGSYRYEREYPIPRPGSIFKKVASVALPIILIALVAGTIGSVIYDNHQEALKHPKPPTPAVTYKNGEQCGKFHIGDIATIDYGDYEGAEVKIVGGCRDDTEYQVITTKDQTLFGEGSKHPDQNDKAIKAGLTLSVNDNDNLVVTGHSKD